MCLHNLQPSIITSRLLAQSRAIARPNLSPRKSTRNTKQIKKYIKISVCRNVRKKSAHFPGVRAKNLSNTNTTTAQLFKARLS